MQSWEPTTIEAIKAYKPSTNSLGSGQVLHCPYEAEKAKLVLREMADMLALDLVDKGLVTDQIVVTVGYDIENLTDPERRKKYHGAIVKDHYGRQIPKHAHGTANLGGHTSSTKKSWAQPQNCLTRSSIAVFSSEGSTSQQIM